MTDQTQIWKDRKHYLWFPFSFTKYWIEEESLYIERGLLSTKLEETLLYRVTDITLERSLGQKICGTGTLILQVRVDATPEVRLENIKQPYETRKLISKLVEEIRNKRKVVGKEFYGDTTYQMGDSDSDMDVEADHDDTDVS